MNSVDWANREEVRELVIKHYLVLREAAVNGDIECAQLGVLAEVKTIMLNLDNNRLQVFNLLYCEESASVASMLKQEALKKQMILDESKRSKEKMKDSNTNRRQVFAGYARLCFVMIIFFTFIYFIVKHA